MKQSMDCPICKRMKNCKDRFNSLDYDYWRTIIYSDPIEGIRFLRTIRQAELFVKILKEIQPLP